MNLFNIIGGAIKQGFQNLSSVRPSELSSVGPNALASAKQAYANLLTDIPTNVATAQRYVQQAVAPKYSVPSFDQIRANGAQWQAAYNKQTDMQRLNDAFQNEGIYMDPGNIKSGSADLQPMAVYPNDPRLSALKEAALNAMNLRPAMKRYLQTIPVQQGDLTNVIVNSDGSLSSAGGTAITGNFQTSNPGGSWESNVNVTQSPNIVIDRGAGINPGGWPNTVMQHEYLHTTEPIRAQQVQIGMTKLLQALPQNSPLRDAALQYYNDGRLPPNPEELFATLGQQLGQYVLTIPEIQAYYKNIYMQPPAQRQMIRTIKQINSPSSQFQPGTQLVPIQRK